MELISGTYILGPDEGDLTIETGREGRAARLGHDLVLAALRWSATVVVDAERPERSTVTATVDAASLVVREASGGMVGLSDSQKAEVEATTRDKVLHSDRHPSITFESTGLTGDATRAALTGDLTIAGTTRPATFALRGDGSGADARIIASTSIQQTDFGITLYSAMMGSLRVKDVVVVSMAVRLPAGP
jgi:polyisoprenoid-binding protein YceI